MARDVIAVRPDLKLAPDFVDLQTVLRSCMLIMINVRMHTRENYFYEQLSAAAMFELLFSISKRFRIIISESSILDLRRSTWIHFDPLRSTSILLDPVLSVRIHANSLQSASIKFHSTSIQFRSTVISIHDQRSNFELLGSASIQFRAAQPYTPSPN